MQMKIVLAAVGFYERDIEYNRNKIIKCKLMKKIKTLLKIGFLQLIF